MKFLEYDYIDCYEHSGRTGGASSICSAGHGDDERDYCQDCSADTRDTRVAVERAHQALKYAFGRTPEEALREICSVIQAEAQCSEELARLKSITEREDKEVMDWHRLQGVLQEMLPPTENS